MKPLWIFSLKSTLFWAVICATLLRPALALDVVTPANLLSIQPDGTLQDYQFSEDDIEVTKGQIKNPGGDDKFEYIFNFVPKEETNLIYKVGPNEAEAQRGDLLLMLPPNKPVYLGETHDLDEDFDANQKMDIAEAELEKYNEPGRIGKLYMHTYSEMKWTVNEIREETFNHERVMNIIKYEYDPNYRLDFSKTDNAMVPYDTMVERYLARLNQLLITKLSPVYQNIIDELHKANPLKNDKNMQFMRSHPIDDMKEEVNTKFLKEFQDEIAQNNLLLATLHNYYVHEIQELVNGGQIREMLVDGLMKRKRNLVLDAAILSIAKKTKKQELSLADPWELDKESTDKMHVQLTLKDILIDIAGDAFTDSIGKEDGGEEAEGPRSYEDKAESTNPVDKFDIILYHIIFRINDKFKEFIAKLGVPSEIQLQQAAVGFVEAANFNKFLVKMIMENNMRSFTNFIRTYNFVTIYRTYTDDIFFNLDQKKFTIDLATFSSFLDLFGENYAQAPQNSHLLIFGERGPDQQKSQKSVELDDSRKSGDIDIDMQTDRSEEDVRKSVQSQDAIQIDKSNGMKSLNSNVSVRTGKIPDHELSSKNRDLI